MQQSTQWCAPRNAAETPWFSLSGWIRLLRHQTGGDYQVLWRTIRDLHESLPASPLEACAPTANNLLLAQADIYRGQLAGQTAQDQKQRIVRKAQAIGVVATTACAVLGQRPSLPQLLSALAMTEGYMIQLAPGEGKTLAIGIAAVLLAWQGKPLHIVTANDYLANRDAELMSNFYAACGVTVSAITQDTPSTKVASYYQKHVVYATAKQLLADFLRDDLVVNGSRNPISRRLWGLENQDSEKKPVMRGLHAVIIDEADGVLIDEATTPLIIASPEQDKTAMLDAIRLGRGLVDQLEKDIHYTLYARGSNAVHFTESGKKVVAQLAVNFSPYWRVSSRTEEIFSLAIMARDVFQLDRHFIVQDGAVVIVDDSTGRAMPGRSWSHGVHQSIEARIGLDLTPLTKISARMTFQEFFRHYHLLSGASGTLQSLDLELWQTFGLLVLRVPPNTPSRLSILPQRVFKTRQEKLNGLINRILDLHRRGLPVLVGTRRILDSEEIASILRKQGVACTVLNAKEHAQEAKIVALAGKLSSITVATNMAGRGTDIGITADIEALGGLQVLMFEAHESPRIDWQLFGRAGRQGARGTAQAFVSLEEELIEKFSPAWLRPLSALLPNQMAALKLPLLQWVSLRQARATAKRQRSHLAYMQKQLREQLGFSKS